MRIVRCGGAQGGSDLRSRVVRAREPLARTSLGVILPPLRRSFHSPPQALFGDSLNADGNGTLTFLDYLKAVNKRMSKVAAGGKTPTKD